MSKKESPKQESPKKTKEQRLSKQTIADVTEIATQIAMKVFEEQRVSYYKLMKDKKLRNTKLLIRKYKLLKDYSNNAVYDATMDTDGDIEEIMSALRIDMGERHRVQSIQNGVIVTSIIMSHIDTMLECYKNKCLVSSKPEVSRRWREVYSMYLADECLTSQEVADRESVSVSMVYQDLDIVYDDLSSMFFGLDLTEFF